MISDSQGEDLLDVLTAEMYKVEVGNEPCTEISVAMDTITCKPPSKKPRDTNVKVRG